MDKKEEHKTEQGEDTDTRKGQGRKESNGGGQRTQAKLPPTQPGGQEPPSAYGGGGVSDTGDSLRGRGRGAAKNRTNDPTDSRCKREMCTVLWDTGAQISLVTNQYAREAGFKGRPASIRISGVGTGNKNKSKVQYRALLRRRDGSIG